VLLITFLAAVSYILWEDLRLPFGANLCAFALAFGHWIDLDMVDAAWQVERLAGLLNDPDSRFGGMLFFCDDQGERQIVSVSGSVVPRFTRGTRARADAARPTPLPTLATWDRLPEVPALGMLRRGKNGGLVCANAS
jgi:hypothetical protein